MGKFNGKFMKIRLAKLNNQQQVLNVLINDWKDR